MAEWGGVIADIERSMTATGRAATGEFVIEGTRLHERALRSGACVSRAVTTDDFRRDTGARTVELFAALEAGGTDLRVVPDEVIERLTGGRSLGAIVGLVPVPPEPSLERLLATDTAAGHLLLVGVEINEPGNVGALVRTALASGATAYIAAGAGDPRHPKAARTSMGSIFKLPVLRLEKSAELIPTLRRHGVATLGAVSSGGAALPQLRTGAGPRAVLLGSEAMGLPQGVVADLDHRVTIPMAAGVDSFSVNAAAAIILYGLRHAAI
jgi:TrmH family RNA methyltransferase